MKSIVSKQTLKIIDFLIKLGHEDNQEVRLRIVKIPNVRSHIWSPGFIIHFKKLDIEIQEYIIKGLCIIDHFGNHHFSEMRSYINFGITTIIPRLLFGFQCQPKIQFKTKYRMKVLLDFLFANRNNPYIPFGLSRHGQFGSYSEYLSWESQRRRNIIQMKKLENRRSMVKRVIKESIAKVHLDHSIEKRETRLKEIESLMNSAPIVRLCSIAKSKYPISFFPDEFAIISSDDVKSLPNDCKDKLSLKLRIRKISPAWKELREKVKI